MEESSPRYHANWAPICENAPAGAPRSLLYADRLLQEHDKLPRRQRQVSSAREISPRNTKHLPQDATTPRRARALRKERGKVSAITAAPATTSSPLRVARESDA
jgi:hypothetical protein